MSIDVSVLPEWSIWVQVGAAVATVLLVLAAGATIRTARRRARQDRIDDRRAEILEWATEIAEYALRHRTETLRGQPADPVAWLDARIPDLFTVLEPQRVRRRVRR